MGADGGSTRAAETGATRRRDVPAGPLPVDVGARKDAPASACPLLRGDLEGWAGCCTRRFLPIARGVAGDGERARDALQNSLLIVQAKVGQFRGGPVACPWVWTIVRREAARGGSERREVALHDRPVDPVSTRPTPERELQTRETMGLLSQAIGQLPPRYREVVRLRDLEGRSTAEAAGRLHLTPSGVASRLQRAHRLLRARLEGQMGRRRGTRPAASKLRRSPKTSAADRCGPGAPPAGLRPPGRRAREVFGGVARAADREVRAPSNFSGTDPLVGPSIET